MSIQDKDYEDDLSKLVEDVSDIEDDQITQNWANLAFLNSSKKQNVPIPKRGEKDTIIDGTNTQEYLLSKARDEMFTALNSSVRSITEKSQVKAYYIPDTHTAVIPKPKGNFLHTMGKADKSGQIHLNFNEFLYLSERGTITPFQKFNITDTDHGANEEIDLKLSIQDLYSFFKTQGEADTFLTYSYLKRLGFIVFQTGSQDFDETSFYPPSPKKSILNISLSNNQVFNKITGVFKFYNLSLFNGFFYSQWNFLFKRYTTNEQIYLGLKHLVPFFKPPTNKYELINERKNKHESNYQSAFENKIYKNAFSPLKPTFDVWKPQTNFKKKAPGLPDFQIVIYNKNDTQQQFPNYVQMQDIFRHLDYKFEFLSEIENDSSWDSNSYTNGILRDEYLKQLKSKAKQKPASDNSKNSKNMKKKKKFSRPPSASVLQNKRLKTGYRSFILCVIDSGIISFAKISEADFASENVWYTKRKS